jgi:hypothetical protein
MCDTLVHVTNDNSRDAVLRVLVAFADDADDDDQQQQQDDALIADLLVPLDTIGDGGSNVGWRRRLITQHIHSILALVCAAFPTVAVASAAASNKVAARKPPRQRINPLVLDILKRYLLTGSLFIRLSQLNRVGAYITEPAACTTICTQLLVFITQSKSRCSQQTMIGTFAALTALVAHTEAPEEFIM